MKNEFEILLSLQDENLGRLLADSVNEEFITPEELGLIIREATLNHISAENLGDIILHGVNEEIIPDSVLGSLVRSSITEGQVS